MQTIIGNSDYSFVASTKKITLAAPHHTVDEERVYKITNLSTGSVIYDHRRMTHDISVSAGVITHTYDASGMANADTLQIIIDT